MRAQITEWLFDFCSVHIFQNLWVRVAGSQSLSLYTRPNGLSLSGRGSMQGE